MRYIDRPMLLATLRQIDDALDKTQRLCLIGSCALLMMGHDTRSTEDVDVWQPASDIDPLALRSACRSAGIGFNPTEDEPQGPYLQVIQPGIVTLPARKHGTWAGGGEDLVVWQGRNLTVTMPPASAIVASKLTRCETRDVSDCAWLLAQGHATLNQCERSAKALPARSREAALENAVFLTLPVAA